LNRQRNDDGPLFESKEKFHGERKFERSDRKPFDRDKKFSDRKPFDRDRKPSDRKPFDRDRKFSDRKPFERKIKPAVEPTDKGPSLPESGAYRFSDYKLRSRRKPKTETEDYED